MYARRSRTTAPVFILAVRNNRRLRWHIGRISLRLMVQKFKFIDRRSVAASCVAAARTLFPQEPSTTIISVVLETAHSASAYLPTDSCFRFSPDEYRAEETFRQAWLAVPGYARGAQQLAATCYIHGRYGDVFLCRPK